MRTANWSRKTVEELKPYENSTLDKDILISISDPYTMQPKIQAKFAKIHYFNFLDEIDIKYGDFLFVEDDAIVLAEIIRDAKEKKQNIWVHCQAGICRSGAIVEILSRLGWEIIEEMCNKRVPNPLVYRLLMEQFPEIDSNSYQTIRDMGYEFYYGWVK